MLRKLDTRNSTALANDSGQNSAALKNITINLSDENKFNTAIEYDTDENRTAYSRVKHYINNGKAYSYEYGEDGNISKITFPFATIGSVSPQGFAAHTTVLRHNPPCSLFPPPAALATRFPMARGWRMNMTRWGN